ncbi:MAG TPA: 4-alpha-glucanotransferase [Anaerolineales bacterium]
MVSALGPRSGGVLLHPSSLPGPYGIGDIGPAAHAFIDWLAEAGCGLWQVLPLGPTGFGNSPYQCHSVFAGNPYLISPDFLLRDGWLRPEDLRIPLYLSSNREESQTRVDYRRVITWKLSLLKTAYYRFRTTASKSSRAESEKFQTENAAWLDDFALYMALKARNQGNSWSQWAMPLRVRESGALSRARRQLHEAVSFWAFGQFMFFRQWVQLRDHARMRGVRLIGDVPIFAAEDSSDVWAHPDLFSLDEAGRPTGIAGVPPDYFAPTGQLWGNPLYHWPKHLESGFSWWIERLHAQLDLVDMVRLDHFRGLAAYWEIPAGSITAEGGRWVPGPGAIFLGELKRALGGDHAGGGLPLIAEDLGVLTPDVEKLLREFQLPGMRVLQFGLAGLQPEFLPHNYVENCVVYTGTHDNDTSRAWFERASAQEREFAKMYLGTRDEQVVPAMVRAIWKSVAVFAIVPMQDLLELGASARMNFPGQPEGNWEWRLQEGALSSSLAAELRRLNTECRRLSVAAVKNS